MGWSTAMRWHLVGIDVASKTFHVGIYMDSLMTSLMTCRPCFAANSLVGPNQTAYTAERQILDGCLVANKIIRMAKLEGHKPLLFKVDFEKAFDSVSWSYLQDIMRQMRFDIKCRKWIDACFSTTSITVLINGSPSKELKMEKVIRQGDPLSPLLFFLVVEALQVSITEACSKGLFKGVSLVGEGTNISLLKYAVDALFFD
ncbi:putative RNA-directed DNA polymerase, eukaryota, reverse transcriptase zinc-binding domain protein [Tanacetum coccineum]